MVECKDKNCPFHGNLKVRKNTFNAVVDSTMMRRTVNIKREFRTLIKKYERYAKRHHAMKAHNPDCIAAKAGDNVTIAECRPVSKTKHFVIISKVK